MNEEQKVVWKTKQYGINFISYYFLKNVYECIACINLSAFVSYNACEGQNRVSASPGTAVTDSCDEYSYSLLC